MHDRPTTARHEKPFDARVGQPTGRPVRIASVAVDPPSRLAPGRVRYRITLLCGCTWWEDHDEFAAPPNRTQIARCFAPHSGAIRQREAVPVVAAHGASAG